MDDTDKTGWIMEFDWTNRKAFEGMLTEAFNQVKGFRLLANHIDGNQGSVEFNLPWQGDVYNAKKRIADVIWNQPKPTGWFNLRGPFYICRCANGVAQTHMSDECDECLWEERVRRMNNEHRQRFK